MSELLPRAVNVNRTEGTLSVVWPDGTATTVPLMKLRQVCPCATCAESRGENPHPGLLEAPPAAKPRSRGLPMLGDVRKFQISGMHHVGRYALGVTWADNHQSIYSWTFLAEMKAAPPSST
ncbi:MAG: DUF971 domain-containing protein [Chloracidobacterium sp.]|uniref:DUF971 domain-containing protein n=1 Tax=Chloracidobacterium validum TaxID=2821543 RepID=A0ABX8B4V8_9BACT|nr:DUF971 domain-containing protein [Chloracidobacterium validum]QUW02022.1 DUF971 domain-containing protein [Chloracidobacterium validum]